MEFSMASIEGGIHSGGLQGGLLKEMTSETRQRKGDIFDAFDEYLTILAVANTVVPSKKGKSKSPTQV